MNQRASDPDMVYWDNLPKLGYHYPATMRILDGKFKSPEPGFMERAEVDAETYRRKLEKQEAERLAREAKKAEDAKARKAIAEIRRAEERAYSDARSKLSQEAKRQEADRIKAEKEALRAEKVRLFEENQKRIAEAKAERLRRAPVVNKKRTDQQRKEQLAKAARDYRERKKTGKTALGNEPTPVIVTYMDGSEVRYESMTKASLAIGCSSGNVQRAIDRGYKASGCLVRLA